MAKFKQAGAIVVRAGKSGPRILLVTARRNPDNWIFPKGHVESGETLKSRGRARGARGGRHRGQGRRRGREDDLRVRRQHLPRHLLRRQDADAGEEREGRRLRWLKYKQALRRLTYDETRDLLREAWPRIKVSAATRSPGSRKKK